MSGNNLNYQRDINNRGEPMAQRSQNGAAFVSVVDPITGMPSIGATTTSAGVDRSVTTSTTSSQLMAANTARRGLFIVNDTAIDVWINFGATAVAAAGSGNIKIGANGGRYESGAFTPSTAINIIAASGTPAITAREFIAVSVAVADAPVIGTATAGRESASLTFTPGASNGGYTVQDYLISAYDSLTNVRFNTFTAASSPATLAPIPAGISAYFKVQARTNNGYSTQSGASNAVNILAPFAAPGAPTGVAVTGGVTTATVTYNAPAITGGSAITSYRSTLYRVSDNSVISVVSGTGPLVHNDLAGGYQVYAKVEAANVPGGYGQASLPSPIEPVAPPVLELRAVSDRVYANQNRSGSSKQMGGYRTVKINSACNQVELTFANWFTDGNAQGGGATFTERGSGGAAIFRSQIEMNGTFYPVLFGGSLTGNAADGANVVGLCNIPIPVAGTEVKIHSYQQQTGAGFIVHGGSGGGGTSFTFNATKDLTRAGNPSGMLDMTATGDWANSGGAAASGNAFGPVMVRALTSKPSVIVFGTSIDFGAFGTQNTVLNSGVVGQQLSDAKIGFVNAGVSSDSVRKWLASNAKRVDLAASATTIIFGGPVNDVTSVSPVRTAAEIYADVRAQWALFPGKNLIQCTMTPLATNAAGQTPIANSAVWVAVNDLIRGNTDGVKVFDIAEATCPVGQRDACIWRTTNISTEGVHPNDAGFDLIRASGVVNIEDITSSASVGATTNAVVSTANFPTAGSNCPAGTGCQIPHVASAEGDITSLVFTDVRTYISDAFVATYPTGTSSADVSLRKYVEYPQGTFTPVLYGGAAPLIMGNAVRTKTSDALAITIPAGATWWEHTINASGVAIDFAAIELPATAAALGVLYNKYASAGNAPAHQVTSTASALFFGSSLITGTIAANNVKSHAVIGDSVTFGEGDITGVGAKGSNGYIGRVFDKTGKPYVKFAKRGMSASDFVALFASANADLDPYLALVNAAVTHLNNIYGVNDLRLARTQGQLLADYQTIYGKFPGKEVVQATLTNRTTSTDAWATTVNQTQRSDGNWGALTSVNTAIRVPQANVTTVIEASDAASTARNSNIWPAPPVPTTDGTHPNSYMAGAMAAAITYVPA